MLAKPVFGQFSVNQITNMIAAEDLNNLLDYYNDTWNTPQELISGVATNIVFDFPSHNDITGNNLERRFGWGQGPATFFDSANNVRTLSQTHITTGAGTEVTITDLNQAISQLNAGLYHTEDDPTLAGLIPQTVDSGQRVSTSLYETVANKIESFIAEPKNKYKTDYHSIDLYTTQLATTSSTPWADDLEVVHKFTFNNYNEARYFFNSGGEFTLELEMAAGGSAGNQVWQDIFNQFDSIRIGAETCRVVTDNDAGETQYDVIATSGLNKGFYTGITYAATPVFTTILDAGVFNYNSGSEYNEYSAYVYVYSEYNSRRIRIQLSADEDTPNGIFNVYVKVILVEDADDTFNITQPITLTSGYAQPSTVPIAGDGNSNNTYMTVGSKLFVFEERVAPTVADSPATNGQLGWQLVDVHASVSYPDIIENFTGVLNQTDFTIAQALRGSIQIGEITIDDVEQQPTVDYTLSGQVVTFTTAPADATAIKVTIVSGQIDWVDGTSWNKVDGPLYNKIVIAGAFVVGKKYKILTTGTTDFTLIGAADSNVDTEFTATGAGTGTGTATRI